MDEPVQITRRDATVSPGKANAFAMLVGLPLAIAAWFLFQMRWGYASTEGLFEWIRQNGILAGLVILLGILLHEALHVAGWALFGKLAFKDFDFGFNAKALMPYAHVRNPMRVKAYRWGAALPGLLLGVLPLLIGFLTSDGRWFVFGLAFTLAALGDALILWLLRKEKPSAWVEDHPIDPGCIILEEKTKVSGNV